MDGNFDYIELVEKARLGDDKSMNRLAESARESLRRYVFRLTLDEAVTQDIVQEVMLEMFKVLGKLKKAERFTAWLNGIAFNRVRRHYGQNWCKKKVFMSEEKFLNRPDEDHEGLASLVNQELKQIIFAAMNQLEPRHRAVLTMRCYDGMSYAEIGETMGKSEFGVRALFFRAKKALGKQLSRRGLGRGSLLTALVLFGKMTAVSEAAAAQVSVTAATTKVGVAAGIAAMATGKAVVVSLAAAGVIAAGAIVATPGPEAVGGRGQSRPAPAVPRVASADTIEKGAHECWYYYPEGSGGPVMMRYMAAGDDGEEKYCRWLQNDAGNYFYDQSGNTIYLNNHRMWESDYSVRRLPTDPPELSDFLSQVEGGSVAMDYIHSRAKDLLVIERTDDTEGLSKSWTMHHYNVLEEDYFQCDWPVRARMIDNRDEMHRRGWTYFTVEGEIGGKPVNGLGRLPFVYGTSGVRRPWLKLRMGAYEISGDIKGLCVRDSDGNVVKSYSDQKEGGIFAGLTRPWAGLHTIDTIRRDAALKQLWFETTVLPEKAKANVIVSCDGVKLDYTIDMTRDVIEKIAFVSDAGDTLGQLKFSYVQNIDSMSDIPSVGRIRIDTESQESGGILWLVKLGGGETGL
ncbi:MAG: sigma-70 family RNA polymerase sigma factor [Planctomycetes bacterium]|nr:sigma-70 family RNA polymerase sigma factor [Planctomycetota bacterium]